MTGGAVQRFHRARVILVILPQSGISASSLTVNLSYRAVTMALSFHGQALLRASGNILALYLKAIPAHCSQSHGLALATSVQALGTTVSGCIVIKRTSRRGS